MRPEIRERIEQIRKGEVPDGYKPTKVGTIPKDWFESMLGDLFEFEGGYPASREQLSEEGICYLHYGDIHKNLTNYIDIDRDVVSIPKLNEEINKISSRHFLQDGDIAFADASEDYEGIGRSVVIYNKKNIPFISGLHTIVARDKKDHIVRDYKRYVFLTHEVRKQFMTHASGISVYGISRNNLKKIKIVYPDKNEQKKIAKILLAWDKTIELKEKLIEQKKLRIKGLMQLLLTGKVRWDERLEDIRFRLGLISQGEVPNGYKSTKVGIIPADWKVVRLKDKFERLTRKNNIGNNNVLTISALFGLIRQGEFFNKSVASENLSNYFLLERGDFAYNKSYSNGYPYGAIKVLEKYEVGVVSPLYICFTPKRSNKCPDFYKYYFEAGIFNREIHAIAQEGARNHGLLNISVNDFFNAYIVDLDADEMKKIVEIISVAEKEIYLLEQELEALKKQKKGLMQLLLTGMVRVHELERVEC